MKFNLFNSTANLLHKVIQTRYKPKSFIYDKYVGRNSGKAIGLDFLVDGNNNDH